MDVWTSRDVSSYSDWSQLVTLPLKSSPRSNSSPQKWNICKDDVHMNRSQLHTCPQSGPLYADSDWCPLKNSESNSTDDDHIAFSLKTRSSVLPSRLVIGECLISSNGHLNNHERICPSVFDFSVTGGLDPHTMPPTLTTPLQLRHRGQTELNPRILVPLVRSQYKSALFLAQATFP